MKGREFRHASLFSGMGGFDLAAAWMGWENVFHAEIDPFCQRILRYHFSAAKSYGDIKETTFGGYKGKIDVLTGGFPCQPFSTAGKRRGDRDDRYLWPEMFRAVCEVRPRWVIAENVRGIINCNAGLVFEKVQTDLESEGYHVWPFVLPAAGVGAPHRRERVWFIAYRHSDGSQSAGSPENDYHRRLQQGLAQGHEPFQLSHVGTITNADCAGARLATSGNCGQVRTSAPAFQSAVLQQKNRSVGAKRFVGPAGYGHAPYALGYERCKGRMHTFGSQTAERYLSLCHPWGVRNAWKDFPTEPPVCPGDDGFPGELDGITFPAWRKKSMKAAGNAIVPQVAFQIFKAIAIMEERLNKMS